MSEVLGGIKVNKMIWFASVLTLSSLFICVIHLLIKIVEKL